MMKSVTLVLAIVALLVTFCGCGSEDKKTIHVYCDLVLQPGMEKIARKFESESGYKVELICDPEDRVFRRMKLSNHADLYISISPALIERTIAFGLSKEATPIGYIIPTMMVVPLNPRDIDSIEDLNKAETRFGFCEEDTILGETTKRLFEKNDFPWDDAYATVQFPTRNEADLIQGILDSTIDVAIVWDITARNTERVEMVEIPPELNVRLPVVALKLAKSDEPNATDELVKFMRAPESQSLWEESGLKPYDETK